MTDSMHCRICGVSLLGLRECDLMVGGIGLVDGVKSSGWTVTSYFPEDVCIEHGAVRVTRFEPFSRVPESEPLTLQERLAAFKALKAKLRALGRPKRT